MPEDIITPEVEKTLLETFARELKGEVTLHVFTKKGHNDQFNDVLINLVQGVARIEKRIKAFYHQIGDADAAGFKVTRSPSLLISPEKYNIRYTGAPLGEEGRSLIAAILMAGSGRDFLEQESRNRIKKLSVHRNVMVFVSPTCPYCPQEAIYAISAAIARPDVVSAEIIEIYENLDLAEEHAAMSVPKTYINGELTASGLEPEYDFISSLLAGEPAAFAGPIQAEQPPQEKENREFDVIIIGAGPAGLSAAVYAGRSGMRSLVLEKANVGGQVSITPVVENYPGFPQIAGKTLVDQMLRQAAQYARIKQGVAVNDIRAEGNNGKLELIASDGLYHARAVIIGTGASYRKLGVPGEDRLAGRGISYCATCDGYLFKDGKNVLVIGGGNTAVTDALYLDGIGARVTLVHRSKEVRAEDRLKQVLFQRNLPVLWETKVVEFIGEKKLDKVRVEDINGQNRRDMKMDGVFIAVGYAPQSALAKEIGIDLTLEGYIKVDDRMRTSMPGVYAAGDITGSEKQITVAVAQGTIAAITAFEDLTKKTAR